MKKIKKQKPPQLSNRDILVRLFILIIQHKKLWLLPLFFVLAFLGLFFNLSGNQAILPAIYALF